ncbi:hypothetical protein Tco_0489311 [Tanacetum coccineum]
MSFVAEFDNAYEGGLLADDYYSKSGNGLSPMRAGTPDGGVHQFAKCGWCFRAFAYVSVSRGKKYMCQSLPQQPSTLAKWALELIGSDPLHMRPEVMTEQRPLIRMGTSNPGTKLAAKATATIDVGDRELDYKCWHRPEVMTEQRPLIRMGASNPRIELAAKATTTMDGTIDCSAHLQSHCQDPGQDIENSHCIAMMEAVNGGKDLKAYVNMLAIEDIIEEVAQTIVSTIPWQMFETQPTGKDSSSTVTTAPKTTSAKRSLLLDLSLDASLDTIW